MIGNVSDLKFVTYHNVLAQVAFSSATAARQARVTITPGASFHFRDFRLLLLKFLGDQVPVAPLFLPPFHPQWSSAPGI